MAERDFYLALHLVALERPQLHFSFLVCNEIVLQAYAMWVQIASSNELCVVCVGESWSAIANEMMKWGQNARSDVKGSWPESYITVNTIFL